MEPVAFVAASAEEAVAQIRARLGPEAVVLNVRPLPAHGLARLWQKPMIEVLAYRPETAPPPAPPLSQALAEFRQRLDQIEQHVKSPAAKTEAAPAALPEFTAPVSALDTGGWRIGGVLQKTGLLPLARPARPGPSALAARRPAARLAGGGNRTGASLPGQRLAVGPTLPGTRPACRDRAGGIGQNDLPLQMAHPGGLGGRAPGARLAPGRNYRQHGRIPDRLL